MSIITKQQTLTANTTLNYAAQWPSYAVKQGCAAVSMLGHITALTTQSIFQTSANAFTLSTALAGAIGSAILLGMGYHQNQSANLEGVLIQNNDGSETHIALEQITQKTQNIFRDMPLNYKRLFVESNIINPEAILKNLDLISDYINSLKRQGSLGLDQAYKPVANFEGVYIQGEDGTDLYISLQKIIEKIQKIIENMDPDIEIRPFESDMTNPKMVEFLENMHIINEYISTLEEELSERDSVYKRFKDLEKNLIERDDNSETYIDFQYTCTKVQEVKDTITGEYDFSTPVIKTDHPQMRAFLTNLHMAREYIGGLQETLESLYMDKEELEEEKNRLEKELEETIGQYNALIDQLTERQDTPQESNSTMSGTSPTSTPYKTPGSQRTQSKTPSRTQPGTPIKRVLFTPKRNSSTTEEQ